METMKIKKELVKRDIAGDTILVPVGKTVYDSNGLFILNELGAFLWDRLEAAQSEEELLGLILDEYEVTEEVAAKDLRTFLDKLRELGIL
jgi:hypothetical protein